MKAVNQRIVDAAVAVNNAASIYFPDPYFVATQDFTTTHFLVPIKEIVELNKALAAIGRGLGS